MSFRRFYQSWGWRIFFVALSCRILFLVSTQGVLYYKYLFGDADHFDQYAWKLATGSLHDEIVDITLSPVFLVYLAALFKIFGHSIVAVRAIQAVLGSVTCVMLYRSAKKTFGKRTAIIAGLMGCFYGIFIFYDGELLKPCLINCLLVTSLYLFQQSLPRFGWRPLVASFLFSLAMLLRMDLLVPFAFLLIGSLFFHKEKDRKNSFACSVAMISVAALNVASWHWWYQQAVPKQTAAFAQYGIHFYIGNQPNANGTYKPVPGVRNDAYGHNRDTRRIVEIEKNRPVSVTEINEYWIQKGLTFITEHPVEWLAIIGKKIFLLLNRYEIPALENYYASKDYSWFLGLPLLDYGIVCPLGLLGLVMVLRGKEKNALIYWLFFLGYTLALLLMIIRADYRLPLHLPLLLFASHAVERLTREIMNRDRFALIHIALLAIFVTFSNYPTFLKTESYRYFLEKKIERDLRDKAMIRR